MKKQLIFVVAVLLVCVSLSGCFGQSDKDKFVGIWTGRISHGIA